ncbi:MAG: hypothetical protein KME04_07210 [Pleurocapsa minor GSE-CHR-MK-17-07R]|jgi:hypothetical protein|nr:hypothetical protein [Pleurocapsa minor GSE-CHR-MK 17-07R]
MSDSEQIEKIRQAIMRYRELLDLLHERIPLGEGRYNALFDRLTEEQRQLPEKERQREAAILALEDLEPLRRAVLRMQFEMRDFEKSFDELYGNLVPAEPGT